MMAQQCAQYWLTKLEKCDSLLKWFSQRKPVLKTIAGGLLTHHTAKGFGTTIYQTYMRAFTKLLLSRSGTEKIMLQNGNASVHKQRSIKKCLDWPAQSPDLNPTKHLWDKLKHWLLRSLTLTSLMFLWLKENRFRTPKSYRKLPRRVEIIISKVGLNLQWDV